MDKLPFGNEVFNNLFAVLGNDKNREIVDLLSKELLRTI
ncbi:hypothetical protein LEP1GSC048_3102 [Leptospira santarosai serovar Shermani str. 1342KT]|nr:hypothetical protein LEP1GSC048_3102 [Leptospira santarosai serovar Shermani str. 1342KT]